MKNLSWIPSGLSKAQLWKVVKTLLWVAASGAVASVVAWITDRQDQIGVFWPIVNVVLVALKQVFTPKE